MRKIGLVAFGVTTCVLVPSIVHLLSAGPDQVAKLVAPDETSIHVGGAKVDVSLDRGLVDAGKKVHVTLTATADQHVQVRLAVLVYEQEGMAEGRTEAPPDRVGRGEVTLDVKDGKASKTFAFTLPGYRASTMDGNSLFGHYTVLVMAPEIADKLETKRRHARNDGDDPQNFFGAYQNLGDGSADDQLGKPGEIARIDVSTRTPGDHLRIVASDIAQAGDDIPVKVEIRNPTKRAFSEIKVHLVTDPDGLSGQWQGIAPDKVTIDHDTLTVALAAHETKDVVFHLHTAATGTLGLFASVECDGDDCFSDKDYDSARKLADNVLDAIDILPAPDKQDAAAAPVAQAQAQPAAPAAAPSTAPAATTTPASAPTRTAQAGSAPAPELRK